MKKSILILLVLAVVIVLVGNDIVLADEKTEARLNLVKKAAGFVGGFASGLVFHEVGHEIMTRIEGEDINWSGIHWTTRASGNSLRNIVVGGFAAEVISTEVILGFDKIPKDNSYVLGFLAFNILNSFQYSIRNEMQDGNYGDLGTLRKTGFNVRYVEVGLIAHSLLTMYRVYKNPKFLPYIRMTKKEIAIGIGWNF